MIGQTVSHYHILENSVVVAWAWCMRRKIRGWRVTSRSSLFPKRWCTTRSRWNAFCAKPRGLAANHPDLHIHDINDNNGHPFIVMEKLEGVSLKEKFAASRWMWMNS